MSGHTPGPWSSFYKNKYDEWHVSLPIPGSSMKLALCPDGIQSENREADARLIAAAPDLLASLKEAVEIIEKHVPRDALGVDHMGDFSVPGGVMTWGVLDEHLHYMRQTIAKAEGRQ